MRKLFISFCLLISISVQAQEQKNAIDAVISDVEVQYLGFGIPLSDDIELAPQYFNIISKNESDLKIELKKLKAEKNAQKKAFLETFSEENSNDDVQNKTRAFEPVVVAGYNALGTSGTPSDNSIAVNTKEQLVAVVNSSIRYYNAANGAGLQATIALSNFFSTPQNGTLLTTSVCDPVAVFDPIEKKFIVFAQTCAGTSSTTQLLFAFSKTEDPTQGWFFYALSGNPSAQIGSASWFDYPKVAVSNSDVFVTGNLFSDGGSFKQSVIYQVNKLKCFAGNTLTTGDSKIYTNISGFPFTIVPMINGQTGGYGDNMYLVSTRNSNGSTTTLNIYEISSAVTNNPTLTLKTVTIPKASSPGDGVQPNTVVELSSGDNRGMSGFYLNGMIHYVFHCDAGNGFSGINYSRLIKNGTNWTVQNQVIKAAGKDYAYPAIASMGYDANDQSAIIHFNYVSSTEFPGMKVVYVTNNGAASNPMEVKSGTGYVDYISSNNSTRWGDYSGMSRVLNATTPTAWCFGMYGNTSKRWTNYFAKITTSNFPNSINNETVENKSEIKIFPNPIKEDIFYAEVSVPENGIFKATLLDFTGKIVKEVFTTQTVSGKSLFSFNKGTLPEGNYLLHLTINNKTIANEKISIRY